MYEIIHKVILIKTQELKTLNNNYKKMGKFLRYLKSQQMFH